jgi:hypothetical protein
MVTKIRDAATHAAERLSIERPKPALVVPSQPHVEEQSLPCTVEQETVGPVFISHALDIPESLENFELLRRMVVERPRIPGRAGGILVPAVAGPFAGNTPRHGEYSVFLPDEIRNAQYVIHDYTFPTAGVVFETGLSIGYRRPFSFFWNESQIRFDEMLLPRCLRYINVVRLKSAKGNKEWFAELIDNPCRAIGSIECPFELWKTCTYNKKVPTRYVFVYCPSGRNLIERFLERYLRETCGVSVITGSSLKNERHWGCALLHHMYHAAYTIIDSGLSVSLNDRIAHAEEYANENEATLLLGIAAARNTRCLRIHAENRKTVSMWGSRPALSYTPDNYESVLGDGIRSLHLKWIEAFSD